ncbi:hypothetical protein [Proteiniphilum propionicum]|nr:hypothetical protein [Proteiniphilum propionicum]
MKKKILSGLFALAWYPAQYCHYYVTYPDGSGTGWSHWNMKNR